MATAAAPVLWFAGEAVWNRVLFRAVAGRVYRNVSADEAEALLTGRKDLMVLDVRSEQEFREGRLPHARLLGQDGDAGAPLRLADLAPETPCLVYCAGGFRSRLVVGRMRELGFREVYNLNRGVLGWKLSGRVLEGNEKNG
jgi:rhodanese-related sulfurtransferase